MSSKDDNILSFADQVEEEFIRLYNELGVKDAPAKRQPDIIDTIWSDIYDIVFKPRPEDVRHNNARSRMKTWDVESVEAVVDKYVLLNKRYGGVIKRLQFCNMTGFHQATMWLWSKENHTDGYLFPLSGNGLDAEYSNTTILYTTGGAVVKNNLETLRKHQNDGKLSPIRFDVWKKLQAEMQDSNTNALSLDTYGHMYRGNNEPELGRLYEPRKMVLEAQTRRMVTDAELIKLGELSNNGTQLEDKSMDILGI